MFHDLTEKEGRIFQNMFGFSPKEFTEDEAAFLYANFNKKGLEPFLTFGKDLTPEEIVPRVKTMKALLSRLFGRIADIQARRDARVNVPAVGDGVYIDDDLYRITVMWGDGFQAEKVTEESDESFCMIRVTANAQHSGSCGDVYPLDLDGSIVLKGKKALPAWAFLEGVGGRMGYHFKLNFNTWEYTRDKR